MRIEKPFFLAVLGVFALFGIVFLSSFQARQASATTITPGQSNTRETPTCGSSPCAVTAANTIILSANTSRRAFTIINVGTVAVGCCYHATTCSATAYDVILAPGTGADDGKGSSWTPPAPTWVGGVTCGGSVGGKVSIVALQ